MVNTRKHNASVDSNKEMPGRSTPALEPGQPNSSAELSSRSAMDNDSDFQPLVSRKNQSSSWRRSLRTRYSTGYRTIERGLPVRACRMRIVAPDSEEDMLVDSDIPFNDEDDDSVYPAKPRRSFRRISSRVNRRTNPVEPVIEVSSQTSNGIKEEEEDDDLEGEEPGVRRSKRQKKLLYGSFNQSWILGTRTMLRGYPDMYGSDQDPGRDQENSNSNDVSINKDESTPVQEEQPNKRGVDGEEEEGDVYSKVKRPRRARIPYSPEVEARERLRPRLGRRVTVADSESESEFGGSSDETGNTRRRHRGRGQRRVYHLRQNKPIVERFQISREPTRRSSRMVLCSVSRSPFHKPIRKRRDSSSSDEERFQRKKARSLAKARSRCLPLNFKQTESPVLQKVTTHSSKPMTGGSGPKGPADVDPMAIDTSVTFDKVGGLESHLKCLKEMVVFPLLYREIFEQFHVQPPKGILFHGPPGTGKTLIARALANECSQQDKKVAFFMRKGADCLSKWVGESERQLRLLFEQAYQMRPSIIFFDEIDGLAPVRSSKQDQIHASIVSTLLALLDGLDDRGDIIVIGATNRIDAIDPALRRPGRFDRELYFPLPGKKERMEILKIHTTPWTKKPTMGVVEDLAERAVGYCGADLRLLCTEAVIGAMRRRYPQVYRSSKKLLLEPDQIQVVDQDFREACCKIVAASCRVAACPRARLSPAVAPLLIEQFNLALNSVKQVFPHAAVSSISDRVTRRVYKPRFLVCALDGQYGQTSYIAPALLDAMEHIPVHMLALDTLMDTSNRTPEEAAIQIIREASRNPPSVLYMPAVDTWWDLVPPTVHKILLDRINQIAPDYAVLLLSTAHCKFSSLVPQVKSLFEYDNMELRMPTDVERTEFWRVPLLVEPLKQPPCPPLAEDEWEDLPLAPPTLPPAPTDQDLEELHNAEEHRLRGLRLFLRDICGKLVRNRQLLMFSKPVDKKEVPDYFNIIKRPMDLETMMTNIDLHKYNCAQEFLADIDLIVSNALEYNPAKDSEDKLIRHRAYMLRDTAYTLIKAEMDTDFEEECRKISKKRSDAKEKEQKTEDTPSSQNNIEGISQNNGEDCNDGGSDETKRRRLSQGPSTSKIITPTLSSERVRRRKRNWAKGMLNGHRRKTSKAKAENKAEDEVDTSIEISSQSTAHSSVTTEVTEKSRVNSPIEINKLKTSECYEVIEECPMEASPESNEEGATPRKRACMGPVSAAGPTDVLLVDVTQLHTLHAAVSSMSAGWNVETMLDCHARILRVLDSYADLYDRKTLTKDIEEAVKHFADKQPDFIEALQVADGDL